MRSPSHELLKLAARCFAGGLCLVVGPALLAAEDTPDSPPEGTPEDGATHPLPGRTDASELHAQLELLNEFLRLPPEQLQRIRRTIHLIESLSPEERASMQKRLARMQLDASQVAGDVAPLSEWLSPKEMSRLKRFWLSIPEEERGRLKQEYKQLPEEARKPWVKKCLARFLEREARILEEMRQTGTGNGQGE